MAAEIQSFHILASAFSKSVFFRRSLQASEYQGGIPEECFKIDDEGNILTSFYLDPSQNHPCAGSDWFVLLALFLLVHCVSWWSRWLIWEPFARWHMEIPPTNRNQATTKTIENFSQSVNAASFHTLSAIFVWRILSEKDWLWSTEAWGDLESLDYIEADFKLYYLLYAARYLSDMVSLCFEHPRSDTFAYAIHHVATVALVLFSAHTGVTRFGGAIMIFLDWADPPMLIAKAFKYLSRKPTDWYQWCADRLFETFAVAFFVTRNLIFTYVVYVCLCFDFSQTRISSTNSVILRSMLIVLVLLMTFWLGLIIKAAINQLSNKGNVEDIREHDHKKKTE